MSAPQTNLVRMKRCRKQPENGEFFYMQLPFAQYLFGRIIIAEPRRELAPGPMCNLIYIYNWQSPMPDPVYSELRPDRLLIAPVWTNRLAWTNGLFQFIESRPLTKADLLPQHCFFDSLRDKYVDERGEQIPVRVDPCGLWGLVSYRWIDDHVSDAVGIPRAPLDKIDQSQHRK
jgi:hypothetical protein